MQGVIDGREADRGREGCDFKEWERNAIDLLRVTVGIGKQREWRRSSAGSVGPGYVLFWAVNLPGSVYSFLAG